jgi:tetratricopeptide (TPR) repeat protein
MTLSHEPQGALSPATRDRHIQDLLNRREFGQAESLIQKRLQSQPQDPDAHYLMGVLRYFQGHIGQSVEALRRSLQLDPHHTDAAICLSVLLNDIGKYDDAKKVFEQANRSVSFKRGTPSLEVERKFAVKHMELADLYFRYRRYDEALVEYGKAALLDPSDPDIRIRRAKAFAKKGFTSRAIQELQQLKSENQGYLPARVQLGLLYYSQGDLLNAELEWEAVLEIEPTHREALAYVEMVKSNRSGRA